MYYEDLNNLGEINLRTLFTSPRNSLPNLPSEYVIYCIHNDVNGKCYIGQARDFFNRFIGPNDFCHLSGYKDQLINGGNRALYSAFKKYKSRSFTVRIVEELSDASRLNELESHYIKELHTCIYDSECIGYNMTWGGDNCDHLHTDEVYARLKNRYNGDLCGMLHTPEVIAKQLKTKSDMWDGDCMGACHTPENLEKARVQMKLTKIFSSIDYCLSEIRQSDELITFEVYWRDIPYESSGPHRHVRRVLEFIDELRSDSRWTSEMEGIFSYAKDHSIEFGF